MKLRQMECEKSFVGMLRTKLNLQTIGESVIKSVSFNNILTIHKKANPLDKVPFWPKFVGKSIVLKKVSEKYWSNQILVPKLFSLHIFLSQKIFDPKQKSVDKISPRIGLNSLRMSNNQFSMFDGVCKWFYCLHSLFCTVFGAASG